MTEGLAARGWQISPGPAVPSRFQVMGERSSGTNFVKRLLGRNTALIPEDGLGWKHGFPQMTAIPADFLVVCVVRDACHWALSMHAKPWHCPDEMQSLVFSDFIRAEWATVADRKRYFPQVAELGGVGQPLQLDRDPLTGRTFANLFALRRAKIAGLMSYQQRGCSVVFARLEAVQAAPEAFLAESCAALGTAAPGTPFQPVVRRLGARFKPAVAERPETPHAMSDADIAFLRASLDTTQEAAMGYRY